MQQHSDFLVSSNKNPTYTNQQTHAVQQQRESLHACTTPTSCQSMVPATSKTSPKLAKNLFHSKETINSFNDLDNTNPSSNYNTSDTISSLTLSDHCEKTGGKTAANSNSNSELYLCDKSMYKKDPGSVCEFLYNKLNQQATNVSSNFAALPTSKSTSTVPLMQALQQPGLGNWKSNSKFS